tara:strand:- start:3154 stop:3381 length:228 start_codon:yes stop_codon:yes gene_type:complete
MTLSNIFLLILTVIIGVYFFILLSLNETFIQIDLLFIEINMQLGHLLLTSFLSGLIIAVILEAIFFISRKRNGNE